MNSTQEHDWLELFSKTACWIGIGGLMILIAQSTWAAPNDRNNSPPSSRTFNPFSAASAPNGPNGINAGNFFEDDDEDELDSPNVPPNPVYNSYNNPSSAGTRTFSAGGRPSNTPEPIRTEQGISIGGAPSNGIISKNKVAPVKIDDETAEGSKDIVTDFNFPDADILDIAKTLGKLTGKNFILDKDVKGRITIISNSPITVGEAWKVFLTALDINGFALIPSGKYLRIARQRDARDKQLKTYTGDYSPDTDALITRVFLLKYISSEEVARTFRGFMPANSRIIPYEQTNTIIVTDTGSNIAKLAKMLEILDIEGYDAGIEVIPVKWASASDLSKLIDALIPGTSAGPSGGGSPPGMARFGANTGRFSARKTKEGGIINTIIADERTNTLIVHANTKGADQVRELVTKLDQNKPSSTGGGKVHVVYLQFADSEQLANTLNNFSSQSATAGRPPSFSGGPGGGSGTGINPVAASLFEGSIKISPDKATNALVITASPSDYVTVKRVIDRLDIPRDQVYVEVVIMDVQIGDNFDFSANAWSKDSGLASMPNGDLMNFIQNPLGSTGGLIGIPFGPMETFTVGGQSVTTYSSQGLIRAIQGHSNASILATPQIIALDNAEANFESAEKIPTLTSTAVQGAGVTQSVQMQPIALSIKIKPQINKMTNFVKLDVEAKLGDISQRTLPKAVSDQAFATTDRTAKTTVVVGDSDTIVLGGLMRDKIQETSSKIPILGDIPILGWLFKSKSSAVTKNNLLIFMTPHIVRQYEKVRAILDKKLKERDDFLETNNGGEDPLRSQRDSIIRSLPDIKKLAEKHPPPAFTIDEEKPAAVYLGPSNARIPNAETPPQPPEDHAPPLDNTNETTTPPAVAP